jgi:hypothetical protein
VEILKKQLEDLIGTLSKKTQKEIQNHLENLVSVYPFNEYEFMISSLLAADKLSFDDYIELRDNYLERNLFLWIFEISAPRGFGEQWVQGYLKGLVPQLQKPNKQLDSDYSGQYDYCLIEKNKLIRIEVKASRAVDFEVDAPLQVKALHSTSSRPFDMNFQQIKPKCCDIFVWIGVWRDEIKYWVLASKKVAANPFFSNKQHRGNIGEGQLHIKHSNIDAFEKYRVDSDKLLLGILSAYKRQIA